MTYNYDAEMDKLRVKVRKAVDTSGQRKRDTDPQSAVDAFVKARFRGSGWTHSHRPKPKERQQDKQTSVDSFAKRFLNSR